MDKDTVPFTVTCSNFSWVDGAEDDPKDLCLHGHVSVRVGDEELAYDCCASAAALRMLRTLGQSHEITDSIHGEQMLPCCGFEMYADKELEHVSISGCPNGVDYGVRHEGGKVLVTTSAGVQYAVKEADYRREVLGFASKVKSFYAQCSPKIMPEDKMGRDGYIAFWNEWNAIVAKQAGKSSRQEGDALQKAEMARAFFKEGYNCSQSVAAAFCDEIGIERGKLLRMVSSFGGGMGRMREVCGAVSGMFFVAGALYGYDSPKDMQAKKEHYARIQQLAAEFKAEAGSIVCRELLGLEGRDSSPVPSERTAAYYKKRPCAEMIAAAARLMQEYINRQEG